jgi:membrane protease YdiL (CAAX protease family)
MTQRSASRFARLVPAEPAPPWTLLSALISIVAAFVAMIAASAFVVVWMGDQPAAPLVAWSLGAVLTIVFVARSRRDPGKGEGAALRLQPPKLALPLILFVNVGLAMALDLLSLGVTGQFLPLPELLPLAANRESVLLWVVTALFILFLQPVAEELVFRGVGYPALRAALGGWGGVLVSALAYGAFHLLIYPPVVQTPAALWYAFVLPTLDGLVFALWRSGTGSTRAAMYAHAGFGLFALLKVFALSG